MLSKETIELNKQGLKKCCTCKTVRPHSYFSKHKSRWDGLNAVCKPCGTEKDKRKWADLTTRERKRTQHRKWLDANREATMIHNTRATSKEKNLEHNITKEDIFIPEYCPVLGMKLEFSGNGYADNAPSVDRIDNTKGYVKGNVQVISWRANTLKRDATLEELKQLVNYLEKLDAIKSTTKQEHPPTSTG